MTGHLIFVDFVWDFFGVDAFPHHMHLVVLVGETVAILSLNRAEAQRSFRQFFCRRYAKSRLINKVTSEIPHLITKLTH